MRRGWGRRSEGRCGCGTSEFVGGAICGRRWSRGRGVGEDRVVGSSGSGLGYRSRLGVGGGGLGHRGPVLRWSLLGMPGK